MVRPEDLTGVFTNNWWSGFSSLGSWLGTIFFGLLLMGLFWFLFQMLQYKVKVTYFPIQGDTSKGEINIGKPKNDRGRRIKKHGVQSFRLFLARKTIKDVPFELQYPDGVFLLRKSSDEFVPIPRPSIGNPSVKIDVIDPSLQLWDYLRGQDDVKRFTDQDWQKKQMLIFVGVIIGCLVFAGIVIWMSYATSNATLAKTDQITSALANVADKIGLGAPG